MSNIFLISDHHFGHNNILTFTRNDGSLLRDFDSVEAMDEHMIEKHNSVVRPQDKVYFLGDVTMGKRGFASLARLNGEKVLIKGNHDKEKLSLYMQYFKDVRGSHQFDGMLLTHIPVHTNSLGRWPTNVHGHLHSNVVTKTEIYSNGCLGPGFSREVPDTSYFCVCVEQIDYTPVSLEDLKLRIAARKEKFS